MFRWGPSLDPKRVAGTLLDVMFGSLAVGGVLLEVRFGSLVVVLRLQGALAKARLHVECQTRLKSASSGLLEGDTNSPSKFLGSQSLFVIGQIARVSFKVSGSLG
jgi:hypothetical protein